MLLTKTFATSHFAMTVRPSSCRKVAFDLKYCARGTWNERYKIESCFGFLEGVCHSKKVFHRTESHLSARFWYVAALLNCLLVITNGKIEFAQFAL